jgi:xanthine dehydrogenase large subunit
MARDNLPAPTRIVHQPIAHDSAMKHVTGEAMYTDDAPEPSDMLHALLGLSAHAHARLLSVDLEAVRAAPGVVCVLTATDIPGVNDVSLFAHDEPVFATDKLECVGQPIFAVVATSLEHAHHAASLARIDYEPLTPLVSIADGAAAGSDFEPEQCMSVGDAETAIAQAPRKLSGRISIGGQEHFYLEACVCVAIPQEDDDIFLLASTQNPTEMQRNVARVLGRPYNAVTVETRRMGGGFGGKETQPSLMCAVAALAAVRTRRPVKLRLDRDDDMALTGKRHDFTADYEVGFTEEGLIEGVKVQFASRCGRSIDLSLAVADRTMTDFTNAYHLGNADIRSRRFRTNTVSNTAFRGFGGPQGIVAMERVIDEIAFSLGRDPADVRRLNFMGVEERNVTPYGQFVKGNEIHAIFERVCEQSDYHARRDAARAFNKGSRCFAKGIAITPVTYGVAFSLKHLNQAGALIHVYHDGSIHLNHGGTEMGQGLFIKIAQIVAQEFEVGLDRVKITATTTGKVPNTSPTAASSGSDLNGMAALDAARKIRKRLTQFAAEAHGWPVDHIQFRHGQVGHGSEWISFDHLVEQAYFARVALSATGFYKTPDVDYDRSIHKGPVYHYFTFGACVSEVIVDLLTGEHRMLRADLLHDVGRSLNPAIDLGQIEGAFIQGAGWLTTEELVYDERGKLTTHAPSTYKIPVASDRPDEFNVEIWAEGHNPEPTIHRSKAVGEPPLCLAASVFCALTDAVASVADYRLPPRLDAPATPEAVLLAIDELRARAA